MPLYKVLVEQKITKRVMVVVDAGSDEDAMNKACEGDIVATESTLNIKIDEYIPIETEKYS